MPFLVGAQQPVFALADALGREAFRSPDLDPPVLAPFLIDLAHRAAEVERFHDRFFDERRAAGRLHHRRGHVARRDDRVLRRRRRVHQVRLVEDVAVEFPRLRLLHDDLRCLRNAGQQLVRRVRREDQRVLAARPILADRVHVLVEVVESGVRQPRFIEMQRLDAAVQRVLQHLHVIGDAVIGALRERQDPRLLVFCRARERVGFDSLADVVRVKRRQRDRTDDTEMIACRRQEHRDRSGHRDRVQDRDVAVAVDDRDVAGCDVCVPDHLVRRRRAVGDEEAVIGVEDPCRISFGGRDRPRMIEQLSELVDRIADVGAQHVLAEELMEHLADRAFEERDAARVAGTVPRVGAILRIVDERAEEGRRERVEVRLHLTDDVPGDELRRVLEHVDEAVELAQHVVRDMPRRARLAVEVDRDFRVLEPDLLDELAQI